MIEPSPPPISPPPILPPVVLSFSITDPTTGMGVFADCLTLAAIGCHPAGVVTAVTIQDTVGVSQIHGMSPELIAEQARNILEDLPVAALKLGLLGSAETVRLLGEMLEEYDDIPLVFDPILSSGAGDDFVSDEILEAFFEEIIPQTTVLTPNIHEARRLVSFIDRQEADTMTSAQLADRLLHHGCEYVLITGTHAPTNGVENILYQHEQGEILKLTWERLPHSFHGAGCTLSSAIAGYMAHGIDVVPAIKLAQEYVWQALRHGYRIGMGKPLPNRFFWRAEQMGEPLNTIKDKLAAESPLEASYPGH